MKHQIVSEKLSIEQTAKVLNCSKVHVRNLISQGELPASKVGRLVRIDSADIDAMFAASRIDRGNNVEHLCQG
ncbi:MAG: helix-turn-helix domain-containing protein [Pirellula sp.]|jgi:excisionase family DNA binding protein